VNQVPSCRGCGAPLEETFVDLGLSPLANALIAPEAAAKPEARYPLHVRVCARCMLVQLPEYAAPAEIFSDYPYFSSFSDSWRAHCQRYAEAMIARLGLGPHSNVVEVGSNDGTLLACFVARGVPVLGIEPAANVAEAARGRQVPTEVAFFGRATAQRLAGAHGADLIAANNVLAHVPDVRDFVAGLKVLLKPGGTITIEFPHLLELMVHREFDTIYHEHFSYFSLLALESILAQQDLAVRDVELLPTHGGSLRVFIAHRADPRPETEAVASLRARERAAGLHELGAYRRFAAEVAALRADIRRFFAEAKAAGKHVVGYAAAAKATTLLSYCGIGSESIDYVVDRSPHKQGRLLPGSRLPIHGPERIRETKPDYLFLFAWNLRDEIMRQMAEIRGWGGKFVVPIPQVTVM
jgi:SAM-dependent methyltransferase